MSHFDLFPDRSHNALGISFPSPKKFQCELQNNFNNEKKILFYNANRILRFERESPSVSRKGIPLGYELLVPHL